MPNAIDAFRAQREAAEAVYERLQEISAVLAAVRTQVDAVAGNAELRALLQREEAWLAEASRTVSEVRARREHERRRFWPSVVWRWALALMFALVAVWATRMSRSRTRMSFASCAPVPRLLNRLRTGSSR